MSLFLYDSRNDKVENVSGDFKEYLGSPIIIGDYVYWLGDNKVVQYSMETSQIKTVWDIDIPNVKSLDIIRSPESNYMVLEGFSFDEKSVNPSRDYFVVTYDPGTENLTKKMFGNTSIQIGKYGCYKDRIAFVCRESDPVFSTAIKVYYPETGKIDTIISNKQRHCTYRGIPRMNGNMLAWDEVDLNPYTREECSTMYALDLGN
jgi:hypothetical protein